MVYIISEMERKRLGQELVKYYDEAWVDGVRGLFDRMARANMGKVTGYLDVASDTYSSLQKKSNDAFMVTFKSKVEQSARLYFSNMPDVARDALPMAKAALDQLASLIPVPVVSSIVGKLIGFAGDELEKELHARAVARADEQLTGASGGEVRKIFTNEAEAQQCIDKALEQYKTIGRYIDTMPKSITTFQQAITFPASVFKVQQAASSLNVALQQVRDYLESMQSRLGEAQRVYADYKTKLGTQMPAAVDAVLQKAYSAGFDKGVQRRQQGKPAPPAAPVLDLGAKSGAATQLAAYVAHALATGVYDGNNFTRGRSARAAMPPMPQMPSTPSGR